MKTHIFLKKNYKQTVRKPKDGGKRFRKTAKHDQQRIDVLNILKTLNKQ